jgi:eukaryotic-like serine/threonine-protein kinase
MTPAQLREIDRIFHSALEHEPAKRGAFLDIACGGDGLLRRKVDALLSSDQQATDFIEKPPTAFAARVIEAQAKETDSVIGRTIGHYKITQHLGSGGMGEVYVALDTRSERKAVLKLLPARFTSDPERIKRFRHEARALVALNHPNILTTYEIGEEDSTYYIASELVEGETLRQRLDRHRLQLKDAIDVTIQAASALASAHEAGIVHRDIKPENIMLRRDGYVKVLDFGIAKLAEQELPSKIEPEQAISLVATHVGSVLGTVRYMSPEQARGEPVNHRTDIWSLGVVLYEMVTGYAPFAGDTPKDVISAALTSEPAPIARHRTKVPFEFREIISRALRKDRQQRYTSVNEMLDALRNLQRKLEVATELARAPLWLRWIRTPGALFVALLVIALAVSLPLLWRSRSPESGSKPGIAVLPLENLSEEKSNAYFVDGIQDEILARLSKIADLKVISRTSTQKYKSAPANLRDIAQQLGVSNILEGSVQQTAARVRISVQLINATNDSHLWAETYDRKLIDTFQVESDVAENIAGVLEAKLTGKERASISSPGTDNLQAYEAYLHAVALRSSRSTEDEQRYLDFSRRAVELDPQYAQAWSNLAIAEANWYLYPERNEAQKERARVAAETALRLAPESADAQTAIGTYYYHCLHDFDHALQNFAVARQLAPSDSKVIGSIAFVKRRQGKMEEAIALQKQATELDPLNEATWIDLARSFAGIRKFTEARSTLDHALKIVPNNSDVLAQKAETYIAAGDLPAAWQIVKNLRFAPDPRSCGTYVNLLIFQRRFDDAIAFVSSAIEQEKDIAPIFLAVAHAALGHLYWLKGQQEQAQVFLLQAEVEAKKLYRRDQGPLLSETLMAIEAELGRRDEVQRFAQADLKVIGPDRWQLPYEKECIARAYITLGDLDHALPLLSDALRAPCVLPLTPAHLRLDPFYDSLRNDPRFQKLAGRQ